MADAIVAGPAAAAAGVASPLHVTASSTTPTSPDPAAGVPIGPVLIDASDLAARLDQVTVLDTRDPREFLASHVAGARSFHLAAIHVDDSRRGNLNALGRQLQRLFAQREIDPRDEIVLVDRGDGSGAIGVFLCELAGASNVSLVRGGVVACQLAGLKFVEGSTTLGTSPGGDAGQFPAVSLATVATIDDVRQCAAALSSTRLLDVRSQLEHEGIVGSPCCAFRGNIPHSLHLEWTTLLDATGAVQSPARIVAEAAHVGLSVDDELIVYCHTGMRSAVAGIALRSAGFHSVRNFLGSWHEWSQLGLPRAAGGVHARG